MNLLIVDSDGCGLDLALRCLDYNHQVKLFIKNGKAGKSLTGRGLVERVYDWEKWMQWADVIFPTSNNVYIDRLDEFRKYGYPVFGPNKASASLEINRGVGMKLLEKFGIECPPYKSFPTLEAAEAHVWKTDGRFVFKTLGDEEDKSLSYVSKSPSDLIQKIRGWKKNGKKLKGHCMLQQFIPGIELGVSAWMNKSGFGKWKNVNVEHKKLMSGNYGPNTGETGTVMQYSKKEKLFNLMLKPLEDYLVKIGHLGDIDMNCIIDDKGKAWPLEFTSRPGWPAFNIMCREHIGDPLIWMADALQGKDTLEVSTEVAVGVVVAIPEFPYTKDNNEKALGIPVYGISDENWDHIHPSSMMVGKGVDGSPPKEQEMFVTSGEYVMVVSGLGETVRKARKDAYKTVEEIYLPNMIVRDDIGEKLEDSLPKLHEHGFALDLHW